LEGLKDGKMGRRGDREMEKWNDDGVKAGFCVWIFKAALLPAIIQRKRDLFWLVNLIEIRVS